MASGTAVSPVHSPAVDRDRDRGCSGAGAPQNWAERHLVHGAVEDSAGQIAAFQSACNGNARRVSPINGRGVTIDAG